MLGANCVTSPFTDGPQKDKGGWAKVDGVNYTPPVVNGIIFTMPQSLYSENDVEPRLVENFLQFTTAFMYEYMSQDEDEEADEMAKPAKYIEVFERFEPLVDYSSSNGMVFNGGSDPVDYHSKER